MWVDPVSEFHRPGLEPAGAGDEWTWMDERQADAQFTPPADLRCTHGRNFCALCDGEGAS